MEGDFLLARIAGQREPSPLIEENLHRAAGGVVGRLHLIHEKIVARTYRRLVERNGRNFCDVIGRIMRPQNHVRPILAPRDMQRPVGDVDFHPVGVEIAHRDHKHRAGAFRDRAHALGGFGGPAPGPDLVGEHHHLLGPRIEDDVLIGIDQRPRLVLDGAHGRMFGALDHLFGPCPRPALAVPPEPADIRAVAQIVAMARREALRIAEIGERKMREAKILGLLLRTAPAPTAGSRRFPRSSRAGASRFFAAGDAIRARALGRARELRWKPIALLRRIGLWKSEHLRALDGAHDIVGIRQGLTARHLTRQPPCGLADNPQDRQAGAGNRATMASAARRSPRNGTASARQPAAGARHQYPAAIV